MLRLSLRNWALRVVKTTTQNNNQPLFSHSKCSCACSCVQKISCNMIKIRSQIQIFFVCVFCSRFTIRKHVCLFLFHKRDWSYHTTIFQVHISHTWVIPLFYQNISLHKSLHINISISNDKVQMIQWNE